MLHVGTYKSSSSRYFCELHISRSIAKSAIGNSRKLESCHVQCSHVSFSFNFNNPCPSCSQKIKLTSVKMPTYQFMYSFIMVRKILCMHIHRNRIGDRLCVVLCEFIDWLDWRLLCLWSPWMLQDVQLSFRSQTGIDKKIILHNAMQNAMHKHDFSIHSSSHAAFCIMYRIVLCSYIYINHIYLNSVGNRQILLLQLLSLSVENRTQVTGIVTLLFRWRELGIISFLKYILFLEVPEVKASRYSQKINMNLDTHSNQKL